MKTKKLLLTCAALLLSTELVPAFTHPGGLVPANIAALATPVNCNGALTGLTSTGVVWNDAKLAVDQYMNNTKKMSVRAFADSFSTTYGTAFTPIWPLGVFKPGSVYTVGNTTIDAERTTALARAIYTLTLSALKNGKDGVKTDSVRVEVLVKSLTTNLTKIGGTDGDLYTCTDLIHIVNALEIIQSSNKFSAATKTSLRKWVVDVLKPAVIREMGFMYMANHNSWACLAATLVGHATDDTLLVQQACAQTISMMDYNSKIDATTNPTFGPFYNDMVRNWNFGGYGAAYTAMNLFALTFNAIALYNIYEESSSIYGCNLFNYTSPNGTSLKSIAGWFDTQIHANQSSSSYPVSLAWPSYKTATLTGMNKDLTTDVNGVITIKANVASSSFLCSYFEGGFQSMSGCEFKVPSLINDGTTTYDAYFTIVSVPKKKSAINAYTGNSNGTLPTNYTCTLTLNNTTISTTLKMYDIFRKSTSTLSGSGELMLHLSGFGDWNHNRIMPILGILYNDSNWQTLLNSTTLLPNFSAIYDGGVNAKEVGLLYFGVLDNSISSPTPLDITLPNTSRRNAAPVSLLQFVH